VKIVNIALIWTGIIVLIFWMTIQESERVTNERRIENLEGRIKWLERAELIRPEPYKLKGVVTIKNVKSNTLVAY